MSKIDKFLQRYNKEDPEHQMTILKTNLKK